MSKYREALMYSEDEMRCSFDAGYDYRTSLNHDIIIEFGKDSAQTFKSFLQSIQPQTEEVNSIYLHKDDFIKLEEVLLNPPEPNASLVKAYKRYKSFQSESIMYTEEEVCGFAEWFATEDYIHRGMEDGEWFYRGVKHTKEELLRIYLNSLQPKTEELKERFKLCPNHPNVLISQCGICNDDFPKLEQPKTEEVERGWTITDRTVIDKQLEAIKTVMGNIKTKEQAIQFLKDSGIELEEQPSPSIKKEDKISKLTFDKEISQWVDIYSYELGLIKGKEEGYKANNSLDELEKWVREERYHYGTDINSQELINKLYQLKTKLQN